MEHEVEEEGWWVGSTPTWTWKPQVAFVEDQKLASGLLLRARRMHLSSRKAGALERASWV